MFIAPVSLPLSSKRQYDRLPPRRLSGEHLAAHAACSRAAFFIALAIAVIALVAINATVACHGRHPCDRRSSLSRSSRLQPPKTRLVIACSLASLILHRRLVRSMGGEDPFVLLMLAAIGSASGHPRSRPAPKKINFIVACSLRIAHFLAHLVLFAIFLSSWRPSRGDRCIRALLVTAFKIRLLRGRVGRVPIDLGVAASIIMINYQIWTRKMRMSTNKEAIAMIPLRWCWLGCHLGITKKHMRMRALSSFQRNISK